MHAYDQVRGKVFIVFTQVPLGLFNLLHLFNFLYSLKVFCSYKSLSYYKSSTEKQIASCTNLYVSSQIFLAHILSNKLKIWKCFCSGSALPPSQCWTGLVLLVINLELI